jgi:pimeloyl-ACP methyl ester carboxylesterase
MDETDVSYHVTYVIDGEGQLVSTVGTLEQMSSPYSANDLIPQMMVVGIVNTNRHLDLTPSPGMIDRDSSSIDNTGGADQMARFMEKELIPYIDDNYPTTSHRALIGHSLGGLFVLNTMIKFPHLFQNYLAIDPFLKWDEQNFANSVIKKLKEDDLEGKKLFIATANTSMSWLSLDDVLTDTTEVMYPMRSNLEFKNSLDSVDLSFSYTNKYYEEENHFQIPVKATYDGYRYFYDFYAFKEMIEYYYPSDEEEDLLRKIEKHYTTISKEMGYNVVPMESFINSWAYGFTQYERHDLGSKMFDLNIKNYPESYNVYSAKANHLLSQNDTI